MVRFRWRFTDDEELCAAWCVVAVSMAGQGPATAAPVSIAGPVPTGKGIYTV